MHIVEVNCAGRYTEIYPLFFALLMLDMSYAEVIRVFKKHDIHEHSNSNRLADLTFKQTFGQFQNL
jgi:hypothetical protein